MAEEIFDVSNVKCGGCATIIEAGLQGQAGVNRVQVDVATAQVTVSGDDMTRQVLQNKLTELGYPVK